jgi:hypothetical protein
MEDEMGLGNVCEHGVDMSVDTNSCDACTARIVTDFEERRIGRTREQRRYEIARDVMAAIISRKDVNYGQFKESAEDAITFADALLAELARGGEGES